MSLSLSNAYLRRSIEKLTKKKKSRSAAAQTEVKSIKKNPHSPFLRISKLYRVTFISCTPTLKSNSSFGEFVLIILWEQSNGNATKKWPTYVVVLTLAFQVVTPVTGLLYEVLSRDVQFFF